MKRVLNLYRDAYSGLSPSLWWLSIVMLINRAGTMVIPFMTLYLTQYLDYSISKAGIIMAVFGIGAVCGGYLGGWLTDRIGFYYVQIVALSGGGVLFMVLGQMQEFNMICLVTFLLSLVNEAFRPANAAAIAAYSGFENRTRSFSLNRLAVNLGWSMGGALGGFIASRSYELLFMIDGLTNLSAAFMLWILFAPSRKQKNEPTQEAVVSKQALSAWKDKNFLFFIVLTIAFAACFFQLFTTLPVYYREQLNLTENMIGVVMSLNGVLIALFEMVLIRRLEKNRKNLFYISSGIVLVGISFMIFNLFSGGMVLAVSSAILMTTGEIASMAFMNTYWIERTQPGNRGQYAGIYTMSWSIAQVTGPALGAQIADFAGFHLLWWIISILCFACAWGFQRLKSK